MNNQLFRTVAVTRMSSPDQLDQVVRLTSAREWLALLSLVLLVVCSGIWGFEGRLSTRTEGGGLIIRAGKPVSVVAPGAGQIADYAVKPGDYIKAGQVVAILAQKRVPPRKAESLPPSLQSMLPLLQDNSALTQEIESPWSGKVMEIEIPRGSRVKAGSTILSVQPDDVKELEVALFVPALKAQELKPGMAVEITPSFIRAGEYGFMRGKVRTVAGSPLTEAALMATLQNSPAAQAVAAERPVNEVRVQLMRDRDTPSGYQWSTKKGAALKITPETPCVARIIVREDPPVTLVIPTVKNWLEAF